MIDCCSCCHPLEVYKAVQESTRRKYQGSGTWEEDSGNEEGKRSYSQGIKKKISWW